MALGTNAGLCLPHPTILASTMSKRPAEQPVPTTSAFNPVVAPSTQICSTWMTAQVASSGVLSQLDGPLPIVSGIQLPDVRLARQASIDHEGMHLMKRVGEISEGLLRLHDGVRAGLRGQESIVFLFGATFAAVRASDLAAVRQGLVQLIAVPSVLPYWQLSKQPSSSQPGVGAADSKPPAIVEAT